MIPYGRQTIDEDDIEAVVRILRSDWLTTGPAVVHFEHAVADFVGASHAAALSSGTAALHAIMFALGIGPGDEVIVPAITFAASANCVLYQGGTPVFADVDPETLLLDPMDVARRISPRTKVIVAVDYAGQPCDYNALQALADTHGLILVADACHSLGGGLNGRSVGTLADLTAFSFHPVKHITSGEGGMVVSNNETWIRGVRLFRNHGIASEARQRAEEGRWQYDMVALGYNYRITDIQCALGKSQLRKLPDWIRRRQAIAERYNCALAALSGVTPLAYRPGVSHAYHLYVIRVTPENYGMDRDTLFSRLHANGIGVQVHYRPVYLHPYYRALLGTGPGDCPQAEAAGATILSLPMYPGLTDEQIDTVLACLIHGAKP